MPQLEHALSNVFAFKAQVSQMSLFDLVCFLLVKIFLFLQRKDSLDAALLKGLRNVVIFVEVLKRKSAGLRRQRRAATHTISPSSDTFSPRTRKSPRSISA